MRIIAGKPYKVTLNQNGKSRVRWQIKFWAKDEADQQKVIAQKTYKTRSEAIDNIPELVRSYSKTHGGIKAGAKMKFSDLVSVAESTFYAEAKFHQGRKTSGVRSYKAKQSQLKFLKEYFDKKKLTNISKTDLYKYREWRLEKGSRRGTELAGTEISLSTVNREFSTLRKLLNHAKEEGWIERNPFAGTEKIIDSGAETARTRTLSKEEEGILLALCRPGLKDVPTKRKRKDGSTITIPIRTGNEELTAAVLFALDCGMRRGEILSLKWKDIDLVNGIATILATHTKTQKARQVGLTDRLVSELKQLPSFGTNAEVFLTSDIKRSWNTARKLAGLEDLRFHDLRGTAASRMISQGVPLATVGKTLGHEKHETTLKHYVRLDSMAVEDVRQRMNAFNSPTHELEGVTN